MKICQIHETEKHILCNDCLRDAANERAEARRSATACSAEKYGPVRKLFGIYYIVGHDPAGWWITGKTGYKTMMNAANTTVTAPDGGIARQIILGRWMLMLMSPQNASVEARQK